MTRKPRTQLVRLLAARAAFALAHSRRAGARAAPATHPRIRKETEPKGSPPAETSPRGLTIAAQERLARQRRAGGPGIHGRSDRRTTAAW